MIEGTRLEIAHDGGTADAKVFMPEGAGPFPLVVQIMDAGGLRPAMDALAQPLVEAGYAVVQPNLYWRSGPFAPFDFATVFSDPGERARIFALMNGFTPEQAMSDIGAFIAALERDARVDARRVGCVGYCMGGRQTFYAAAAHADRIVAAASIHGGGLVTDKPNSPHQGVANIRGRLYFACADQDGSCTPAHRATLASVLDAASVAHEIDFFAGFFHSFAVQDAPVYAPEASARQWQKVLTLFGETLRG